MWRFVATDTVAGDLFGSGLQVKGNLALISAVGTNISGTNFENVYVYRLADGVWTRDMGRAFRMGKAIQAGRVWTNCYHLYPAHAAFGGYKTSGVGRENHRMMLDHYSQTKCLLVSYDPNPLGFF